MTTRMMWRDWMFTHWYDDVVTYTFGGNSSRNGRHRDFRVIYKQLIPTVGIYVAVYKGKDVDALRRYRSMRRAKGAV